MIGKADRRFWKCFEQLPASVQRLAREKYALWKRDPYHPSLHFEEGRNGICVVRIEDRYRAVGLREGDVIVIRKSLVSLSSKRPCLENPRREFLFVAFSEHRTPKVFVSGRRTPRSESFREQPLVFFCCFVI